MSRTIHGLSHRAIAPFRKNPASLSVYWIYVSRMNNEGVAWPSSASLAKSTDWNKAACLDGRSFLVSHGALERVDGYIRPEWRKLDAKTLKRKLSLDRSEYYRPTGFILLDMEVGTSNQRKEWLLYNGADEASEIDNQPDDGKPRRPSSASSVDGDDGRPDSPELDSSMELDSTSQLDSKDSAPESADTARKPHERNPLFDAVAAGHGLANAKSQGGRIAMIANWLAGTYEGKAGRKVGFISAPATVENIESFFLYWTKTYGADVNPPLDFVKFVEHWRKWASSRRTAAPAISKHFTPLGEKART